MKEIIQKLSNDGWDGLNPTEKDILRKSYKKEDLQEISDSGWDSTSDSTKNKFRESFKVYDAKTPLTIEDYKKQTQQMVGRSPDVSEYDKTSQTLFPRTSQTSPSTSPVKQQLTSLGLDLLSLPGRTMVSIPKTARDVIKDSYNTKPSDSYVSDVSDMITSIPSRFASNLKLTETPSEPGFLQTTQNVGEDIIRGPMLPIPGLGSVVPKTATFLPKLAAGLGDIAIGAGMGTAESVARTGEVNPLGVGIGGVLGSLNPLGRVVKAGADKLSDNAFTSKFVKTMQEQALNGNADAQKFLNNFAQNPNSQTVRDRIADELAYNDLIYGAGSAGMKAYNEARKVAEASGETVDEANIIGEKARVVAEKAFRNNYNTPVPQLSPDKTIKQAVSEYTGFEAPNIPRPLTYSPAVRSSVQGASEITGMPNVGAWLSLLTGAGSPYFAYDALRKNPHWASDATRYIPKQTGTVTRNLGATLLDGSGSENRR